MLRSYLHSFRCARAPVCIVFLCVLFYISAPTLAFARYSRFVDSAAAQTTSAPKSLSSIVSGKSPTSAVLRSLVFPGWGQFYNESYFKAAAFAAGAVSVTSIIVWNDTKYVNARNRYDALPSTDALKERTYKEKEFYRDQRDVAGLWLLGVYALASIDAFVGAHLFDFDVSEKGVTCLPMPSNGAVASLNINVRF